jgi:hypothetical protein
MARRTVDLEGEVMLSMAEQSHVENGRRPPATVVNGTRVTIAFPFSKISQEEASPELQLLAELVARLADAVAKRSKSAETEDLRCRAHELAAAISALGPRPSPGTETGQTVAPARRS